MKENKNRPGPRRIFLYVGVPLALLFVVVGAWFVYAELSSRSGMAKWSSGMRVTFRRQTSVSPCIVSQEIGRASCRERV